MSDHDLEDSALGSYDADFYEAQIQGSILSANLIAPHVLEIFPFIESVVDIGCGSGAWLAEFKKLGVKSVTGFDGGTAASEYLLIDQAEYHEINIAKELSFQHRADLAISLEVAEHLDEVHAEIFVSNLCKASDLVLFSAAVPDQGGTHHVNEQWPSYWLDLFGKQNYVFFDVLRGRHWNDYRIEWWYRQNIFLVVNADMHNMIDKLTSVENSEQPVLDIVHPDLYRVAIRQLSEAREQAVEARSNAKSAMNEAKKARDEVESYALQSDRLAKESNRLAEEIESLVNSRSWRLTRPLRKILAVMKKALSLDKS